MRKVLLTVIHIVLFVPIAGVVRLFHDPLDRAWDTDRDSYWIFTGGDRQPARAEMTSTARKHSGLAMTSQVPNVPVQGARRAS